MPPSKIQNITNFEEAVFQSMIPLLEAEGFSVFIRPSRDMLPTFMNKYRPDAVAYKEDRKIAIDIKAESFRHSSGFEQIHELFYDHPDWELRIVYAPPRNVDDIIPAVSKKIINSHLRNIEHNIDVKNTSGTILILWSVLEATARQLIPAEFEKPQVSSRLVEILASEGYVTPDEADMMRALSHMRNQIAHGRLDLEVNMDHVRRFIDIIRVLLSFESQNNN